MDMQADNNFQAADVQLDNHHRPLVTIALMTYRQEKYAAEAVRSVLSQTYEPLRIVISDDASPDGTWDVILREVESYKEKGGCHKDIVLNRNEQNVGIVPHWSRIVSFARGELLVAAAGDDVSDCNRVKRIVEEWERKDRRPTVIHHGAYQIDIEGNVVGEWPPRSVKWPQGAVAAYAMKVFKFFEPLPISVLVEDVPWSWRAFMLGPELQIDELLCRCRVGSGVSTSFKSLRGYRVAMAQFEASAFAQLEKDVGFAREQMDERKYREVVAEIAERSEKSQWELKLLSGTLMERFAAIRWHIQKGKMSFGSKLFYVRDWMYILPPFINAPLVEFADLFARSVHNMRWRA